MKKLMPLVVFLGIPAILVTVNSENRPGDSDITQVANSLPSYDEENVERCFFWIDENNKDLEDKVE